jgi:hypothetical protein
MSRKKRGQKRNRNASTPQKRPGSMAPWIVMGLSALVGGAILIGSNLPSDSVHPDPRPGITGATVIPASRYVQYARVSAVYAQAREIAPTLDGLYCHCDCSKHSGHRSLLSCFESDHGAACDICLSEASIAYTMLQNGRTLDDIRGAIDEMYGG